MAEAIAVIGLTSACIDITKAIIEIGRAVHDAKGLPNVLREAIAQLPVIEDLLTTAKANFEDRKVAEQVIRSKDVEPILKQCEQALSQVKDIFEKACPKEGDNLSKRVWKGTKAVFGWNSKLQKLLEKIHDNFGLLQSMEIFVIGDKLDELQKITEALAGGDSGTNMHHSGSGHNFANSNGTMTYNGFVMSGDNAQRFGNIRAGTFNAGPHTHHHPPPERPETPPTPSSNIPYRRDPDFVDRTTLTGQMRRKLSIPAARVALVGLGGIGKSQIAIEHCYRVRELSKETWVLWIHASNAVRYEQSVRDIADFVKIAGRKDPGANIFRLFRNWLRDGTQRSWMIVLDNADNVDFLLRRDASMPSFFEYLPVYNHGKILITTRARHSAIRLVSPKDLITVDPMDEEQAQAMLTKKLVPQTHQAGAAALVGALEYMPLAITQAAAYINQMGSRCSVQQYTDKLQKNDKSEQSILYKDAGDTRRDPEAKNAIVLTWQISFEHIRETRSSAADLLSLMSCCDRHAIPRVLLCAHEANKRGPEQSRQCRDHSSDVDSFDDSDDSDDDFSEVSKEDMFDDDITMLEGYSFVYTSMDATTFEMHRLVQLATQRWLKEQGQQERWKECFAHKLSLQFPMGEFENWDDCKKLYPQAKVLTNLKLMNESALLHQAIVMEYAGWYAKERGAFKESETMCRRSMKVRSKCLGEDHPDTLKSMNYLALAYSSQGRYREALQLETKVVEGRKKVLGEDHPDTLNGIHNLAYIYWHQGRWDEAEELQVKVAEGRKKVLGEDNPDTQISLHNLAVTYWRQGRWDEAEHLQLKVTEAVKNVLGEDHPRTLTSMKFLAKVYKKKGRYSEAEQLQVRVMNMSKKVHGKDHPKTLNSMNSVAKAYETEGRWDEAMELRAKVAQLQNQAKT